MGSVILRTRKWSQRKKRGSKDPKARKVQKEGESCLAPPSLRSHVCCRLQERTAMEWTWDTKKAKNVKKEKARTLKQKQKPQGKLRRSNGREIMDMKQWEQCRKTESRTLGFILNKRIPHGVNHEKPVLWRIRYWLFHLQMYPPKLSQLTLNKSIHSMQFQLKP